MPRRGKILGLIAQSDVRIDGLRIPPGLYSATVRTSLSGQHRKRTLETKRQEALWRQSQILRQCAEVSTTRRLSHYDLQDEPDD